MKNNPKVTWLGIGFLFLGFVFMLLLGFYAASIDKALDAVLLWLLAFTLSIFCGGALANRLLIKEIKEELEKIKQEIISKKDKS